MSDHPEADITQALAAAASGEPRAAEQLLPLVYDKLRRVAALQLAQERPGQTLQATALVHEAYLRLVGGGAESWDNRLDRCLDGGRSARRYCSQRRQPRQWS